MTKRKANAGPKGFQPGNRAAAKEVTKVAHTVTFDPEQLAWLRTQPEGISPTVRRAIDLYRNLTEQKENTMAKVIVHYEDGNGKHKQYITQGEVVSLATFSGNVSVSVDLILADGEKVSGESRGGINPTWHVYRQPIT